MEDGIYTYYVDMPTTVRSFVVSNDDMCFTIMINARMGSDQQMVAYMHEIEHIKNGDYDKHCSVDLIELAAHGISVSPEYDNILPTENSKCMGKQLERCLNFERFTKKGNGA